MEGKPERRKSDVDLTTIRESQIRTETLLKEVVKPAVSQVYDNEKAIIRIDAWKTLATWIGSTIGLGVAYTVITTIKSYFKGH